jgi:hypothetical protein
MIIDRHSGPAQQSRALGVQARTLEIYAQLGIADKALALGKVITPYPYILVLGQDDNELIMGEKLGAWNVQVQWNTELIALGGLLLRRLTSSLRLQSRITASARRQPENYRPQKVCLPPG